MIEFPVSWVLIGGIIILVANATQMLIILMQHFEIEDLYRELERADLLAPYVKRKRNGRNGVR